MVKFIKGRKDMDDDRVFVIEELIGCDICGERTKTMMVESDRGVFYICPICLENLYNFVKEESYNGL